MSSDNVVEAAQKDMKERLSRASHKSIYDAHTMHMLGASDDNLYRIVIDPDEVTTMCMGLDTVDSELDAVYPDVVSLPMWVKRRIAVRMCDYKDHPTPVVKGVGRRIEENIFWVVR